MGMMDRWDIGIEEKWNDGIMGYGLNPQHAIIPIFQKNVDTLTRL
jgi:hypothetical protein